MCFTVHFTLPNHNKYFCIIVTKFTIKLQWQSAKPFRSQKSRGLLLCQGNCIKKLYNNGIKQQEKIAISTLKHVVMKQTKVLRLILSRQLWLAYLYLPTPCSHKAAM